jgi:hypothetical protein
MIHFPFYINDYNANTAHLTNGEDLAYRRLLDTYYSKERPISKDTARLAWELRVAEADISTILGAFFELTSDGWVNRRVEQELDKYRSMKTGGKKGSDARWGKGSDTPPIPPLYPSYSLANEPQCQSESESDNSKHNVQPGGLNETDCPNGSEKPVANKAKANPALTESFARFWSIYPRRQKKALAFACWVKINPDPTLVEVILNAVQAQTISQGAALSLTRDRKYIPLPTTWLNGNQWDDEIESTPNPPKRELKLSI